MSAKPEKKGQGEGEATKKKLPLIPLLVGVVVLVLGMFIGKAVLGNKKEGKPKPEKVEVGISLALDEFLVNLNGGGDHYLRAQISLGLRKGLTEEEAKEHVAPMRDAILSVLSSKTLAQVSKPGDREALKKELKLKINAALSGKEIKESTDTKNSKDSKDSKDKDSKDKEKTKEKDSDKESDKDSESDKESDKDSDKEKEKEMVAKVYFTGFATQ